MSSEVISNVDSTVVMHAAVRAPQDMRWTSFDRFARYVAVAKAVEANFGTDCSILDVGDGSGYLQAFSGWSVVSVDLEPSDAPLPGALLVQGSGISLPFADRQFDVVVTCDALEHVPPALREAFLGELVRVSRLGVVVAAPFDTAGVAATEMLVERYAMLATGQPQVQLDEHRTNGLPDLEATARSLGDHGLAVAWKGNGNLQDWLVLMLMRYQIGGRAALQPLADALDTFYNSVLRHRNDVAPFYRHVVVATANGDPVLPVDEAQPFGISDDTIMPMLAAVASATFGEVERQDVQPGLIATQSMLNEVLARTSEPSQTFSADDVLRRMDEIDQRLVVLDHRLGAVTDMTDAVVDRLAVLRADAERLFERFSHPVAALRRRLRRRA